MINKGIWKQSPKTNAIVSNSKGNLTIKGSYEEDCFNYYGGYLICESITEGNAGLVVDAGNTYNECGLLPSELLNTLVGLYEMVAIEKEIELPITMHQKCESLIKTNSKDGQQ